MKVELIDSAGGDISIVNSARVSFDKESDYVYAVGESPKLNSKDVKLVKYLAKHKHMTPFRHNFIQLRCSVPVFLARQLMKHQAGLTWNEVSRRYVDELPEFYYPSEWRERPDSSIKQGSGSVSSSTDYWQGHYAQYVTQCVSMYNGMLSDGIAPEMARMVLPQSMMVDFIWSGNLLAFAHVYNLRSGEGAQHEAKVFAELLDKAIAPKFPVGWKALKEQDL